MDEENKSEKNHMQILVVDKKYFSMQENNVEKFRKTESRSAIYFHIHFRDFATSFATTILILFTEIRQNMCGKLSITICTAIKSKLKSVN